MSNSLATNCDCLVGWLHGEIWAKDACREMEIELIMFKQRNRHKEKECMHIYKHIYIHEITNQGV